MNKWAVVISMSIVIAVLGFANASDKKMPDKFNAEIGGFMGQSYWVSLENNSVVYSTSSSAGVLPQTKVVFHPTASDWATFKTMLNSADVWNWENRYENREITDGTQWKLEITWGKKTKKSSGDNAFPDKKYFNQYLKAVGFLIKGNEFR